jgi:hypothetical protein
MLPIFAFLMGCGVGAYVTPKAVTFYRNQQFLAYQASLPSKPTRVEQLKLDRLFTLATGMLPEEYDNHHDE